MQGLPDTLRQQDFMSQPLLSKRYSATCNNHHLPAFILQHGHLAMQKIIYVLKVKVKQTFTAVCKKKNVKPAPQLRQDVPEQVHIHLSSPQHSRALQQFVWLALTHCDGQRTSHGDEGGWLQHKNTMQNRYTHANKKKKSKDLVRKEYCCVVASRNDNMLTFQLWKCSAEGWTHTWLSNSEWQAAAFN